MVPPATYAVYAVSAARRSWGPSGSHPWLLGGSEDPWLSVPAFRRVWLFMRFEDSIIRVTTYKHYGNYVLTEKS